MGTPPHKSKKPAIIVVNDDPTQLRFLHVSLEKDGYDTRAFQSAAEALRHMITNGPPDLIVTDLHMPEIDGWRFCRLLRSHEYETFNDIPILVISATYSGEDAREITSNLGANAFLPAPTSAKILLATVRSLINGDTVSHTPRVLIVEDSRTVSTIVSKAFEKSGYEARVAENGSEARRFFDELSPDIIVLDYHLPDLTGDMLLEEWKKRAPISVFVMMTNDPDPKLAIDFMSKGASAYIAKPFDPDYLIRLCEHAQRERSLLHVEDLLEERTRQYKNSENNIRSILENLPSLFWLKDTQNRFVLANQAMARDRNLPNSEALAGKTDYDIWPREKAERYFADDNQVMNTRQRLAREEQTVIDGKSVWRETIKVPLINEFGTVTGTTGYARDITEQKRAQDMIRKNEGRLLTLLNLHQMFEQPEQEIMDYALEQGVALTGSKSGYITFVDENETNISLFVWPKSQEGLPPGNSPGGSLVGTGGPWMEIIRHRNPIIVNAPGEKSGKNAAGKIPTSRHMNVPAFEGERIVLIAGVSGKEEDYDENDIRQLTLLMQGMWSLLQQKRAQEAMLRAREEKRNMEAQMQHVQKLESLGVLAGGIAHDFNNILSAILGYADLALRNAPVESKQQRYLNEISKSARRAADLCSQMLAYSGKGSFQIEPIHLTEIIRELEQMIAVFVGKKIQINYLLEEELPLVEADITQMRQVIMNLVTNASEAIGDQSGLLSISTGHRHCTRAFLADSYLCENPEGGIFAFVEVSDSGCGMEPNTLERIFEPFFSTKFTGRGLGLAAVLGIVRAHRGAIKVTSAPGKGSIFQVFFPAANPIPVRAATQAAPAAQPANKNGMGGGLILVADDEEYVRDIVSTMVQDLGFEVLLATNGQEAVKLFQEHQHKITAALVDMTMPGLDGAQVLREIRKIKPDARVILTSGYSQQDLSRHFLQKDLAGFIQKPYTLDALETTLRQAVSPSRP